MEQIISEFKSETKAAFSRVTKASYVAILNACLCVSIYFGLAPNVIELFNVGYEIPISLAPAILLLVNIIMFRSSIIELKHLEKEKNRLQENNPTLNDEDTVKILIELNSQMSVIIKPNLIIAIGNLCGLFTFIWIVVSTVMLFFPDLLTNINLIVPIWLLVPLSFVFLSYVFALLYFGELTLDYFH